MKKIIYILLTAVLALSFMGCPTVNSDLGAQLDITGFYLKGEADNWGEGYPLVKQDDGTWTANFVAPGEAMEFKVATADWATAYPLDKDGACVVFALGEEAEFFAGDSGLSNPSITGLTTGKNYTMVVTPGEKSIFIKVIEGEGGAAAPAKPLPYYLDGLYLVGAVFAANDGENAWNFGPENLIYGASVDSETGIVTYTKDIKAIAASGEMGINDADWENKQPGVGVTIAAGEDYKVLDGTDAGNFAVSGLEEGAAYRVYIQTTPEGQISVKIEQIVEVTYTFEVTGLSEGDLAWLNGSVWGSDWPCGWPLEDWGKPKDGLEAPTADETGVAVFGDEWDFTTVAKPGETLTYQVKVVASKDNWETTFVDNDNISFNVENIEAGTYLISVSATDNTVTVTKQN